MLNYKWIDPRGSICHTFWKYNYGLQVSKHNYCMGIYLLFQDVDRNVRFDADCVFELAESQKRSRVFRCRIGCTQVLWWSSYELCIQVRRSAASIADTTRAESCACAALNAIVAATRKEYASAAICRGSDIRRTGQIDTRGMCTLTTSCWQCLYWW